MSWTHTSQGLFNTSLQSLALDGGYPQSIWLIRTDTWRDDMSDMKYQHREVMGFPGKLQLNLVVVTLDRQMSHVTDLFVVVIPKDGWVRVAAPNLLLV